MKRSCRKFTLLEAIVALVILAIGLGLLMAQFALAGRRQMNNYMDWKAGHELSNACEYILSVRPDMPLDDVQNRFFPEECKIQRTWERVELPEGFENDNEGAMRLVNLSVEITDTETGEIIDEITFPAWVEEEYAP